MADQATVRTRNGPPDASPTAGGGTPGAAGGEPSATSMVSSVAGFGENLLNLAELQTRLSAMELRKNVEAAKSGGAVVLGGTALFLASLPVALMGIAEVLVSELALKRGYALLIVAGAGFVIAGGCVAAASLWLRRKRLGFPLSGEELARNLNWVRTVLQYSGRSLSRR